MFVQIWTMGSPKGRPKWHHEIYKLKKKCNQLHNIVYILCSGRFGRLIVIPKDGDNNMLRAAVFKELRILDEIVQNVTAVWEDQTYNYGDICAMWMDHCFSNNILNLDHIIDEVKIYYTINKKNPNKNLQVLTFF